MPHFAVFGYRAIWLGARIYRVFRCNIRPNLKQTKGNWFIFDPFPALTFQIRLRISFLFPSTDGRLPNLATGESMFNIHKSFKGDPIRTHSMQCSWSGVCQVSSDGLPEGWIEDSKSSNKGRNTFQCWIHIVVVSFGQTNTALSRTILQRGSSERDIKNQ